MAYIRPVGDKYKAEIEIKGVRRSKTHAKKADAVRWAAKEEAAINALDSGAYPRKTVADALDKYAKEISPDKDGERWERMRIEAFKRDFPVLAATVFHEVKTPDLVKWKNARLKTVEPSTVLRDISLFRNVWTVGRDEWHWCGASPWTAMKMPVDTPPRDQRTPWSFIKRMVRWLGYRTGQKPCTGYQQVALAYLIELRTAMRCGEVMGLTRETINLKTGVVTLEKHKTDKEVGKRYVPLTYAGRRLLAVLLQGEGPLWTVNTATVDALFRKARKSLAIKDDITFHDGRAEALTQLAKRVDLKTLARISGHRDVNILMSTYYRETATEIAARL